ncbi:hypothetical protein B7463_g1614, partial [Scytalidium lignicola]
MEQNAIGLVLIKQKGYWFTFLFASNCASKLNNEGRDTAVLVVSTGLAPRYQYPYQLSQGVTALKYLLEETERNPSDIALIGDSTAGNLVLALLSHINHPLQEVQPLQIEEKFGGAILVSPITDFNAKTSSTITNAKKDWIAPSTIPTWGDNYAGHRERDVYINPTMGSEEWWKDVKVKEVIVLYGEYELSRDSINTWVTKFKVK